MARFEGQRLFWLLVIDKGVHPFLLRTVIFAAVLPFQCPFGDSLEGQH